MVALPPSRYMVRDASNGVAYFNLEFQDGDHNTLGANFVAGHAVLFDVDHGRIGFAESHCNYNLVDESIRNEDYILPPQVNCPTTFLPSGEPSLNDDETGSSTSGSRSVIASWTAPPVFANAILVICAHFFLC